MQQDLPAVVITVGGQVEHEINPRILKWFEGRGISEKTLINSGVYSGQHLQNGDSFIVTPSVKGEVIVFPYFKQKKEVNCKYRTSGKKFYQRSGGYKTFFNAEILENEYVQNGTNPLVITEGEMDALSLIESGYPYTVSVPDGAPPPCDMVGTIDEIDIEHDTKYSYVFNNWDALKSIRRIVIAADGDEPGQRLAEELVRRLGRVRCLFVEYPEGCKDFNEVLLKCGKAEVLRVIRHAKEYPVSGIYTFSGLPDEPDLVPYTTGWGRLDTFLRPVFPAFMVITGTAGSGKSTWVNQLVAQMSILHGFSIALASFEMRIKPFVSDALLNVYKDLKRDGYGDVWLENHFVFIAPEPDNDDQHDIDWIIDKATATVIRHGIRILVVDPWNEVEHAHRKFESLTEYTSRAIKALKRFGREFNCLVIIVAHPTKSGAEKAKVYHKGQGPDQTPTNEITLYDISDSAHWANKADFGIVINRIDGSNETDVMVKKVRNQELTGEPGMVTLTYDRRTRTFGQ